jgi:hypothetical protein
MVGEREFIERPLAHALGLADERVFYTHRPHEAFRREIEHRLTAGSGVDGVHVSP